MNAAQPKTASEHAAHVADEHPKVQLVPDAKSAKPRDRAQGTHPKANDETCGASRYLQGERVSCELKVGHGGDHSHSKRTWRPRSGDE